MATTTITTKCRYHSRIIKGRQRRCASEHGRGRQAGRQAGTRLVPLTAFCFVLYVEIFLCAIYNFIFFKIIMSISRKRQRTPDE